MYRYIYDRAERATEVGRVSNVGASVHGKKPAPADRSASAPMSSSARTHFRAVRWRSTSACIADAPPVVAVVTDFAVHGFWIHDNVDGYVVATEAMRDALMARGVRPSAILVSGIPVRPEFARRRAERRRTARAARSAARPEDRAADGRRPRHRTDRAYARGAEARADTACGRRRRGKECPHGAPPFAER